MTVPLIIALYAAQTLAAHHRGRVAQTLGAHRDYHDDMAVRLERDAEDIRQQLAAGGATEANQATFIRSRDVETAQKLIAQHLPVEWRADDRAPAAMVRLAQAIADAMQTARGATTDKA